MGVLAQLGHNMAAKSAHTFCVFSSKQFYFCHSLCKDTASGTYLWNTVHSVHIYSCLDFKQMRSWSHFVSLWQVNVLYWNNNDVLDFRFRLRFLKWFQTNVSGLDLVRIWSRGARSIARYNTCMMIEADKGPNNFWMAALVICKGHSSLLLNT